MWAYHMYGSNCWKNMKDKVLCLEEAFSNILENQVWLVHEMYNLVSQQEVIERIKVIKKELVLISKANSVLETFTVIKKTGRWQGDRRYGTEDGTGNQTRQEREKGKRSKQGKQGTRETTLAVNGYTCIKTISNKVCHCLAHCLAHSRKIETESTYRYYIYLSSNEVTSNSLPRSTATWARWRFWNTCTIRSNGTIMLFSLKAHACWTWDQRFYYLSANPFENWWATPRTTGAVLSACWRLDSQTPVPPQPLGRLL